MALPRVLGLPVVYRLAGGGVGGLRLAFVIAITNEDPPAGVSAVATLLVIGEGSEQNVRIAGSVRQQVSPNSLAIGRWTMPP